MKEWWCVGYLKPQKNFFGGPNEKRRRKAPDAPVSSQSDDQNDHSSLISGM